MKKLLIGLVLVLGFTSCQNRTEEITVQGINGIDGFTTYLTTEVVSPNSDCGLVGGLKLIPYTDFNRNSVLDSGEETALSVSVLCNGSNGSNGSNGAIGAQGIQGNTGAMGPIGPQGVQGIQGVAGATGATGPKGDKGLQGIQGVTGATGQTGMVGATGPQGQQGIQGIPGQNAQSGIEPVKLCAKDDSRFPEYGFIIGDSLYAVYYGVINNTLNAFMARLTPGNYMSTNSTECKFTYSVDSKGNQYLDGNLIGKAK